MPAEWNPSLLAIAKMQLEDDERSHVAGIVSAIDKTIGQTRSGAYEAELIKFKQQMRALPKETQAAASLAANTIASKWKDMILKDLVLPEVSERIAKRADELAYWLQELRHEGK